MRVPVIQAALLTVLIAGAPAVAEESSLPPQTGAQGEAPEISSARLAAGVREYPARVLRSLLQVAEDPLVLRQLADEPGLLERPEEISPPVPANLHAAIRELSVMPAIVTVSADHPTELQALRELYAEAPEEMEEYVLQLRAAYNHDEFGATVAWQEALERDPAALEEYRKLVTRFCEAQREAYGDYPCVQVRAREYYYACPPNEAIIFYAIEHEESAKALQVIGQWWETYAPYELDARILDGGGGPIEFEIGSDTLAAMPPEQRASMWRAPEQGYADSGDLVPVIMQPPADQPPEARYARAVAEQARLWTPEMPVEAPADLLGDVSDAPVDQWSFGDEGGAVVYDDWQYREEPLHELIYDDDWDYASNWAYGLGTYGRVRYGSYHTYYSPIVVYYRGYSFDWPLFYGCDPWWLLRSRICATYIRCGYGYDPYWSYRPGRRTRVCYGSGHWGGGYYDGWWRRGHRNIIRVGRRSYHRCSEKQIAGALPHRKTYSHGQWYGDSKGGGKHSGLASLYGLSPVSRKGAWQGSYNKHSYAADIARTRKALTDAKSRAGLRDLLSGRTSAREHTKRGLRAGALRPATPTAIPKRSAVGNVGKRSGSLGRLLRPSASGRKPSQGSDRASRSRPTSSRAKAVAPRRSSSSSGSLRSSPRPQSSSKPMSVGSSRRSGTSGRSSGISSGRSSGSKSKSAVVPRKSSSSRGSLRSSPRPQSSSKPRTVGSSRRSGSSGRSSGISSGRSSGSKSKSSVVPGRSGSSRRSSGISSGRSSGSKSKTTVAPRRGGSSHRSARVSSRPQSSSKARSIGSSRRSGSSHRSSGISSRRSKSPK